MKRDGGFPIVNKVIKNSSTIALILIIFVEMVLRYAHAATCHFVRDSPN